MSLIKLPDDAFDVFTVTARPSRVFSSSSSGISGSLKVYRQASSIEKIDQPFSDGFIESSLQDKLDEAINASGSDRLFYIEEYMGSVNESLSTSRSAKEVEVIRFVPSFDLTSDTLRKNVIKDILYPYYRGTYSGLDWSYTNYLSLHFPDSIGPSSSSIIYPSPNSAYTPSNAFTIEFYVKPSYTSQFGSEFHAATILHASSSFAVSMVTGSQLDLQDRPSTFRIALQLLHSTDITPSSIDLSIDNNSRTYPNDLIFLSDDDSIHFNQWHHVAIRWSPNVNNGTGSFYIDGQESGIFSIPSSSVSPSPGPRALLVGNYCDGPNGMTNTLRGYFNEDAILYEGVSNVLNTVGDPTAIEPEYFFLEHPFKGELHEIRIWDAFRDDEQVFSGSQLGINFNSVDDLLFYLPPHFVKESGSRLVLQTPFHAITSSTEDPFNVAMAFGVGGHLINLENHVREFKRGYYPRLLHLTASTIDGQTLQNFEANDYLYATGSVVKRNITILPNDNGKFYPNFENIRSGSSFSEGSPNDKFVTSRGGRDLTSVSLNKMVNTSSLFSGISSGSDFVQIIGGASPEDLGVAPGSVLTIFQRTRDPSSNLITFFDASNIFYGSSIHPGTYVLTDNSVTGTSGVCSVTLKDNGYGGLYRADASSSHAQWSRVGSILYTEGISTVLSPYLGELFGKDDFTVSFRGEQQIHVLETQAIAPAWTLNTSSNPTWRSLYSSDYANDDNKGFVYINTINFHDENLNIVAKASMAQPIVKRPNDRIMFRTKFDF